MVCKKTIFELQIQSGLMQRTGKTVNNFPAVLPPIDSDMANYIFKDPYLFNFLGTDMSRREVEIERKLIEHIQSFLLELGQGFAFVVTPEYFEKRISELKEEVKREALQEVFRIVLGNTAAGQTVPAAGLLAGKTESEETIEVSGVSEAILSKAKKIDGVNYCDDCFGVCIQGNIASGKFTAIEDEPDYNFYYVDNLETSTGLTTNCQNRRCV